MNGFRRTPWFPLTCVLAVTVVVVLVLFLAGAVTAPMEVLNAFAAVLAGVGTVALALTWLRR